MRTPIALPGITVIDRNRNSGSLHVPFRRNISGPEDSLIRSFLKSNTLSVPKGTRATLFCEPKLDSGYPDLVLVIWNQNRARLWDSRRSLLKAADIKLLHYLYQIGPTCESDLVSIDRSIRPKIRRLQAAKLIEHRNDAWVVRPLRSIFAVRDIIAVEAKIAGSQRVLKQALLNTRFASQSYILVPVPPKSQLFLHTAAECGVGIWSLGETATRLLASDRYGLPRSYVSWMFNEWVCQIAFDRGEL